MRKEALLIPFLIMVVLITACEKIDVSKLSDKDLERISKELIVCNKPYIRYASDCCLDKNDNVICDKDEGLIEEKETPSGITPPVTETPTEPTKPEIKETPPLKDETFQEKCTLQEGISCLDFKVTSSYILITLRNDINRSVYSVKVTAENCGTSITPSILPSGREETYTISCASALTGSKYDGKLDVTYTETVGVTKTNIGQLTAKINEPSEIPSYIPTQIADNLFGKCYNVEMLLKSNLCVLDDLSKTNGLCNPISFREILNNPSAPVQITRFFQNITSDGKIRFIFDLALNPNFDIFWNREGNPADISCPTDARTIREVGNNVGVEITEIPTDTFFTNLFCGSLDNGIKGVVKLVNGFRTPTCTADLNNQRDDSERLVGIKLRYNYRHTN